MIVNARDDGWEIIYQRSHANLAAMLVAAWQKEDHVPRWTELLIATAQHDDQEMFWSESTHLTDTGEPMDFTQGAIDTSLGQAQLVIDNAYRQGVWIALLISMHNSFLYEPKRGEDKQLDDFLDKQQRQQKAWRQMLGYNRQEAEAAYAFLRWADTMSLILCRNELPPMADEKPVAPDRYGEMVRLSQLADGTLTLHPWVLQDDELHVSVEVRYLEQVTFESETSFQQALDSAEIDMREWCFKKPSF
ncbi:DUF3891 family protein [Phototrophicus methaneseepsis]|uniref:DUF3891 family protein n=1 Tax=Phototrophicus methaneseepsis TaxID=2710758 RepID=A0A7S8ICI2_9CHLR|nr:DUF3891 family protein [Phototrophicus methaneseepsis]QPC80506.1 DUF3891 family protein [Phototrophicus methaneseepsis]